MNLQQLNPWNWFTHEEANKTSTLPAKRHPEKTGRQSLHTTVTKRTPIN